MGQCIGLAALVLLLGNKGLQNAVAEGDTRTISLHHIHTGEDLTITYKRDGRYDEEALKKINHLLRDWRKDEEIRMDPRLLDVVWEVYRDVDANGPIQVVCGYRSPATNAMLRRRSRGVAEYSQHMLGRAMDFFIPGVPLEKQREAGLRLQRGGVGYYPSSGSPFVHMDVGGVRMWPRMSREQLARVFPDGRTAYLPSDGRPLAGYTRALADIEKRGSSGSSQQSIEPARAAGADARMSARTRRNLFAGLSHREDADEATRSRAAEPAPTKSNDIKPGKTADAGRVAQPAPALRAVASAAPASAFNLASTDKRPTTPRVADAGAPSPANVIAARGYWPELNAPSPTPPKDHAPTAMASAPRAIQPPAPESNRTVAPWPVKTAQAADHVPAELALAYAVQGHAAPPAEPVTRALTGGTVMARNGAMLSPPPAPIARGAAAAAVAVRPGTALEDPWLRALVLAPDLQNYMTATPFSQPDMRELRALMDKPDAVVAMVFGDDPQPGLATNHFSGNAVVFVSTMTFVKRTAALP